jgi:hypothetical protein
MVKLLITGSIKKDGSLSVEDSSIFYYQIYVC